MVISTLLLAAEDWKPGASAPGNLPLCNSASVSRQRTPKGSVDVVVVGGGIVGATTAARLVEAGRRVIRVEWPIPGASATRASGAMLGVLGEVVAGEPAGDVELRVRAASHYAAWVDRTGVAAPARGTFVVASARRAGDLREVDAIERAAALHGLACERVMPEDVPGLRPAPGFAPARILHLRDEGFVQVLDVLDRLDAHPGVQVRVTRVVAIEHDGSRALGVRTTDGGIACDEVVLCAGAVTVDLLQMSGLDADLIPRMVAAKGTGVVLDAGAHGPLPAVLRTPNRDFACGVHLVPRTSSCVYLGATNRASRVPHVLGAATVGEVLQLLRDAAEELQASISSWNLTSTVWGLRSLPVDGRPIAGRTALPGLSIVTGTYRNGVLLAPLLADLLVAELDGADADPSLAPTRHVPPGDPGAVTREAAADLAEMLQRDDVWAQRVAPLLAAVAAALREDELALDLRHGYAELLRAFPRPEMVPEAIVELLQRHSERFGD